MFAPDGTFHAVPWPPSGVLEEVFRRQVLAALRRAERLSEEFCASLLGWRHSGFSVHGAQRLEVEDVAGPFDSLRSLRTCGSSGGRAT